MYGGYGGRNLAEGFPLIFLLAQRFEPTRSGTRDVTHPPAFRLCITETRKRDYFKVSGTWMGGISIIRYERARLISFPIPSCGVSDPLAASSRIAAFIGTTRNLFQGTLKTLVSFALL